MQLLADKVWVLALLVGAVGLLGLLHVIAVGVENQVRAHDLRVRVNTLRQQQLDRLKEHSEFRQSMMAAKPAAPAAKPQPTAQSPEPAQSDQRLKDAA